MSKDKYSSGILQNALILRVTWRVQINRMQSKIFDRLHMPELFPESEKMPFLQTGYLEILLVCWSVDEVWLHLTKDHLPKDDWISVVQACFFSKMMSLDELSGFWCYYHKNCSNTKLLWSRGENRNFLLSKRGNGWGDKMQCKDKSGSRKIRDTTNSEKSVDFNFLSHFR